MALPTGDQCAEGRQDGTVTACLPNTGASDSTSFSMRMAESNFPIDNVCWMEIPDEFVKHHRLKIERNPLFNLVGPSGQSWEVRVGQVDSAKHMGFREGWNVFAAAHGLELGDHLVFTLEANTQRFGVEVSDAAGHPKASALCAVNYGIPGDVRELIGWKKMERDKPEVMTPVPVKKTSLSDVVIRESKAMEAAKELKRSLVNPSFIHCMSEKSILRNSLYVPANFSRECMPLAEYKVIEVIDLAGNKWPILWTKVSGDLFGLGSGWSDLANSHRLKVGDVCLFELMELNVSIMVRIFPVEQVVRQGGAGRPEQVHKWIASQARDRSMKAWKVACMVDYKAVEPRLTRKRSRTSMETSSPGAALGSCSGHEKSRLQQVREEYAASYMSEHPNDEFDGAGAVSQGARTLLSINGIYLSKKRTTSSPPVKETADIESGLECNFSPCELVKFRQRRTSKADLLAARRTIKMQEAGDTQGTRGVLNLSKSHAVDSCCSSVDTAVLASCPDPATIAVRDKVMSAAHAWKTEHPSIAVPMNVSTGQWRSMVPIPRDFTERWMKSERTPVTLVDSLNKRWNATWATTCSNHKVFSSGLHEGWEEFVVHHSVKEGDGCVFELIDSMSITFHVHIFRAADVGRCNPQECKANIGDLQTGHDAAGDSCQRKAFKIADRSEGKDGPQSGGCREEKWAGRPSRVNPARTKAAVHNLLLAVQRLRTRRKLEEKVAAGSVQSEALALNARSIEQQEDTDESSTTKK